MSTINVLKELEVPGTPLFLFDCTLPTGDVQHWSTHSVIVNSHQYLSRVLKHNLFDLNSSPENATDGVSTVSITLANADAFLSSIERNIGWKGSALTVTFLFYDLASQVVASDTQVLFRGIANPPDQSTEASSASQLHEHPEFAASVLARDPNSKTLPVEFSEHSGAAPGGGQRRHRRESSRPFIVADIRPIESGGVGNSEWKHTLHILRLYSRAMPTERDVRQRRSWQCHAQIRRDRVRARFDHRAKLRRPKCRKYQLRCQTKRSTTTLFRLSTGQDGIVLRSCLHETMEILRTLRCSWERGRSPVSVV